MRIRVRIQVLGQQWRTEYHKESFFLFILKLQRLLLAPREYFSFVLVVDTLPFECKSLKTSLIIVNFGFCRQCLSCWVRIRIRISMPDPDPDSKLNADPCGSGHATLALGITNPPYPLLFTLIGSGEANMTSKRLKNNLKKSIEPNCTY
jgi:hypothetical protein